MITEEKIRVYEKYSGNIEGWDRFGKKKDKKLLSYKEWELIESLIRDLGLIENKLLSKDYENKILLQLEKVCENEKTKKYLKSLIGKY